MITSETKADMHYVFLPMVLDSTVSDDFKSQSKAWLLLPIKAYILDFEKVTTISPAFYQALVHLKSALKTTDKTLHSINLNKTLTMQINADGVSQIFSPSESLVDIKRKSGLLQKAQSGIDVELINPFLQGAVKTLEVQANTKVTPLKIHLKTESSSDIAIAGIISLITDNFTGSLAICFPQNVFLKIYENMFAEVHTTITKEIEDAAGELLNIIYGQAKIELNNKPGFNLKKAIPTVLVGSKLKVSQQSNSPVVVIPFKTDFGVFHIEIETHYN